MLYTLQSLVFKLPPFPNTQNEDKVITNIEMFYLNTIEQLFLFVELLDQLEVCLPNSRLLTAIPILAVYQNLRWNSNKTALFEVAVHVQRY